MELTDTYLGLPLSWIVNSKSSKLGWDGEIILAATLFLFPIKLAGSDIIKPRAVIMPAMSRNG